MAKKITGYVRLQVPAGKANPSPPIGPALGQRGLNIMEFCKKAAGISKGGATPGKAEAGSITLEQIAKIAEEKMVDLNATDLDGAVQMVKGSARSMGLVVVE